MQVSGIGLAIPVFFFSLQAAKIKRSDLVLLATSRLCTNGIPQIAKKTGNFHVSKREQRRPMVGRKILLSSGSKPPRTATVARDTGEIALENGKELHQEDTRTHKEGGRLTRDGHDEQKMNGMHGWPFLSHGRLSKTSRSTTHTHKRLVKKSPELFLPAIPASSALRPNDSIQKERPANNKGVLEWAASDAASAKPSFFSSSQPR